VAQANQVTSYDLSELLGNDRDRDGDRLELVRVWCPLGGRVFTEEVDGELRVFFQPDANFTGVAYFNYTIADLDDPAAYRVAGLRNRGALGLPERKTFAHGLVRIRVVASPS
jgi:Cadherin-like domain